MVDYPVLTTLFNSLGPLEKMNNNIQMSEVCIVSMWKEFRFYNDKKWFLSFSLEYSFMLWKAVIQAKYINIMEGNFLNIKVEIENGTICYELWGVVQCCKVIV